MGKADKLTETPTRSIPRPSPGSSPKPSPRSSAYEHSAVRMTPCPPICIHKPPAVKMLPRTRICNYGPLLARDQTRDRRGFEDKLKEKLREVKKHGIAKQLRGIETELDEMREQ